jgi:type I restriction enzyme M protein
MNIQQLEKTLWATADKLRNNMDAAEYKHVVLGLIFLKYISDSFEALYQKLTEDPMADPEDADEYIAEHVFFVPEHARWSYLINQAKQPEIGKYIDEAMEAIERKNPTLRGMLPTNYARPELDKQRLGELMDLISSIGLGTDLAKEIDLLGQVYEYFLGEFASAEGKKGGQFYTPACIVKLLVEMLEPYKGRIYDGCCGSGGMFVQSEKFIRSHQGNIRDISVYGQESNPTTYKLARMNLAIRRIEADIRLGDTFHNDQHKDLRADYILANPPFNISDWNGELLRDDNRWKYGIPPTGNANYGWIQHFIAKLSPNGAAGIVLANGSMTSNSVGEGEIRKTLIEANLIDCMVALPSQLFYNTQIPACLWFLRRNRTNRDTILFMDARKMGQMTSRVNRSLTDEDISRIASTYHNWKQEPSADYQDISGFCKSATLEEVKANSYVLTPGRYVGTEETEEDETPFAERMNALTTELAAQFAESQQLEKRIRENLSSIGFEF